MKAAAIKDLIPVIISYLFILLFVYAAVSKLVDFENFQTELGQSPLLSAYAGFFAVAVPLVEILISIALSITAFRTLALYASFCLMVMFTAYIIIILNYSTYVPCSCGGILEGFEWKGHLIFNIACVVLAGLGIYFVQKQNIFNQLGRLSILTCFCVVFMTALYITSENAMHYENPFVRKYIQGSATRATQTELNSNSLYFAGTIENRIYIGDLLAPLHLLEYNSTLKQTRHIKITLDREDFPFRAVQVRIIGNWFFLMDGTVPVIYSGNVTDWHANAVMYDNSHYFSKAEAVGKNRIIFRGRELRSHDNILGQFRFTDTVSVSFAPGLLQKQIDGFFDTDGIMHYNEQLRKFVYTYYYRNEFIVADEDLNLIYRGNTIDTISKAQIKIAYNEKSGDKKFASPPLTVNLLATSHGKNLFINSKIIGKYESREMWKRASIVDVYDIETKAYQSSIYIYNAGKSTLKDMILIDSGLYVIVGSTLFRYDLSHHFKMK